MITQKEWIEYFVKGLKEKLNQSNMTQRELADKIGITEVTLSRYMSGNRVPSGPIIVRMAEALNCKVEDLCLFEK